MPIRFECPQGHSLQVNDEFAGKRAKCPTCGTVCVGLFGIGNARQLAIVVGATGLVCFFLTVAIGWWVLQGNSKTSAPKPAADDLRSLDVQPTVIGGLMSIADRLFSMQSDEVEKARYTLPDLKLVPPILTRPVTRFQAPPQNRRLADGWLLDGSLWSDDLGTCKLLIQPIGIEPVHRSPKSQNALLPIGIESVHRTPKAQGTLPPIEPVLEGFILDRLKGTGSSDRSRTVVPHFPAQLGGKDGTLEFIDLGRTKHCGP